MDIKYINPFINATQNVFSTMLGIELSMEKPVLKTDNSTHADVTGVMGLLGDQKGCMCISLTRKGALYFYKQLMQDEHEEIDADVVDAIGELTNIISGQARKEFEAADINLKAAIPTVMVGKNVEIHFVTKLPILSLPFCFAIGDEREVFHVEFSFE
jgi:chemotaxis protein CheX